MITKNDLKVMKCKFLGELCWLPEVICRDSYHQLGFISHSVRQRERGLPESKLEPGPQHRGTGSGPIYFCNLTREGNQKVSESKITTAGFKETEASRPGKRTRPTMQTNDQILLEPAQACSTFPPQPPKWR